MDDLDKLIEAVKGGDKDAFAKYADALFPTSRNGTNQLAKATSAFLGDMNAALALKEALLPGVYFVVTPCLSTVASEELGSFTEKADNPARALLLATLKAHRAQVE